MQTQDFAFYRFIQPEQQGNNDRLLLEELGMERGGGKSTALNILNMLTVISGWLLE